MGGVIVLAGLGLVAGGVAGLRGASGLISSSGDSSALRGCMFGVLLVLGAAVLIWDLGVMAWDPQ